MGVVVLGVTGGGEVDESSARTTRRWLVLKRGWQVTSVRVATRGVFLRTEVSSGAMMDTSFTMYSNFPWGVVMMMESSSEIVLRFPKGAS